MRFFCTFVPLIAVATILAGPAQAADGVDEAIEHCRKVSASASEQVTCLEATLRRLFPAPTSSARQAGEVPLGRVSAVQSAEADKTHSVEDATSPDSPPLPKGLGAEQVPLTGKNLERAQKEFRKAEGATVVDFAYYGRKKKLILVLDNGQVWQQSAGDLQSVKLKRGDTPAIQIKRGAVSGYRMIFLKEKRTIIVRRYK